MTYEGPVDKLNYIYRIIEAATHGKPFVIFTPEEIFKYSAQRIERNKQYGKEVSITIIDEASE